MASVTNKTGRNLIVGIENNYRGQAVRSVSPVMNVSMKEEYELRDFGKTDKRFTRGEDYESQIDSDTELTELKEEAQTEVSNVRTISVASNKQAVFDITDTESDETRMSIGSRQTTDISVFAGSASSSERSDTPSHTSNTNEENYELDEIEDEMNDTSLDYFCVDHMQLCSMKAINEHHADCENVVSAMEWAEEQQYEKERKSTESLLQKFDTFAGIMIDERKELKRYLNDRKEDVTEEALQMMEDLVTHLLKKQKEFTDKFEELHASKLKIISAQIKRCTMVQKETSTCMKQLAEYPSGTPEYQQVRKKIHDKCPVYEEILRRDFQAATRMDYEFVPNPKTESTVSSIRCVGDVIVRPKPSKLPGFLSQSRETDFAKRTITNITTSSGASAEDTNNCCFSGCTYVTHGRIILADWNNNCLKLFDKNHILVSRLNFESNPWDVKSVDDSKVVTTVPGEERVYIVCYANQSLEIVTAFQTDAECWGITPLGDKFIVTCDPWSKTPSLKVFTFSGKQTAFFQKDSNGEMLFRCAQHITANPLDSVLYVADARNHMLLALSLKGRVIFKYRHEKLEHPAGVAVDNQGHLYVCGKESHNVHQLSKNGEFLRILFSKKDDLNSPRAISFQPDGDNILVTDTTMPECQEFITAVLN